MTSKRTTTTSKTLPAVKQAQEMLLWARRQRIVITELQVGDVRVMVSDLALAGQLVEPRRERTEEELRRNLYAKFGGDALAEVTREADDSNTYEDEGDE